jgi:hypothetical protein
MPGEMPVACRTVLSPDRRLANLWLLFDNHRDDFAPRSAAIIRGLLNEAGVPAAGGIEPPPLTPTLF